MKTVLMIAEKPSLAQSIAKILSNGSMTTRKGSNGACSVHEYRARFSHINDTAFFKMTSVCGHVYGLDFIGRYNNWDKVDPVELFHAPTQKKEATEKLHMPAYLCKEGRGVDYIVLWLDCDKEGENICFEVLDCVQGVMNRNTHGQTVFRAHFSAITDTDIKKAMNNLGSPNKNEALSVDARQELDLRIGCAFTRYQTKFFQGKYGNLDSTLISYGPCQTPTLGFCVVRHDKIQSFKPESYWVIQVQISQEGDDKTFNLDWERVRIFDKEVAQMFMGMIKTYEAARVLETVKKEKVKSRPQALNTVEMLRVASSGLGYGPQQTMQIAERLYTQGYISYPRTETTQYPENFDLKGTLKQQQNSPDWGSAVRDLLNDGYNNPKKGSDAGDHPPITPMKAATENELGHDAFRLYDYITRHFIATLSPDCRYLQTTVFFEIGAEKFSYTGKQLIDSGYTTVMPWQALTSDEKMPDFTREQMCPVSDVKMVEKQTSPPDYLTEAELISLMEKHGIGTDASIPVHINNICERNYVSIQPGRKLKPTTLGIVLVHGYQKIDPDLVLPTMRSAVEQQLNLIAHGKAEHQDVLQHGINIFHLKFKYFVQNIAGMDELFEVSFSPLAASGKPLSRCGKCRRFMKYVQAKPSRLHCSTCDETYSLPQNGNIKLYKELKCPLDEFELVLWTTGSRGKTYPLCPYCFNNPPFKDMRKGMGCNECTHPTCQHSIANSGVSECVECENGIFILDSTSGPKWRMACNNQARSPLCVEEKQILKILITLLLQKQSDPGLHCCLGLSVPVLRVFMETPTYLHLGRLHRSCVFCHTMACLPRALSGACNKCNVVINFFENAHKVSVTEDSCEDCGSNLLQVDFSKGKSPLEDGNTEHTGCTFCDPIFKNLVEKHHAINRQRSAGRGGRGGGRGRGRGGRGRGRGRGKPKDKMSQLAAYFV